MLWLFFALNIEALKLETTFVAMSIRFFMPFAHQMLKFLLDLSLMHGGQSNVKIYFSKSVVTQKIHK